MHKHSIIEQYIKSQIEAGTFSVGNQIQTEDELSSQFGVSRPTVRQAINKLAQNGLLTRIKGKGTFVTEPKLLHTSTSFIASYRMEVSDLGFEMCTKVLNLCVLRSDDDISNGLNIKSKTHVTQLSRVRWINNNALKKPVVYTTVYIPHKIFPQMVNIDFTNTSLYDTLDLYGLKVYHVSRVLEVTSPPIEVRDALCLDLWEPAIFVSSKGYLEEGSIIEYAKSWYPASTSKFSIELQRWFK